MKRARTTLITGGAGFVGANLAQRLLHEGERVILLDNLSRPNVERNVDWLRRAHEGSLEVIQGDVRDAELVKEVVARAGSVFHFAAQVAVTTSLTAPVDDFDVNAKGTLNVLEAARARRDPPPVFFTSTNKVYGGLPDVPMRASGSRYEPEDARLREHGIGEDRPLDFHGPYGCSKGCADQYVHDYARSFGLKTVVFRMSCIYGPRQFGTEDQGWVAHFMLRAIRGEPITIYGDGRQVRDILFVGDLVEAFLAARKQLDRCAGEEFNIGGGVENAVSLFDVLERIRDVSGKRPEVVFREWRTGDQRYYVTNTRKFASFTGWRPRVGVREGTTRLYRWLLEAEGKLASSAAPVSSSGAEVGR
jgi:CDP-paratose 2-epimerase